MDRTVIRFLCEYCGYGYTVVDSNYKDFGWHHIRCSVCGGSHCPNCGHYTLKKVSPTGGKIG